MKFGVIIFPGSNCDHDAYWTIQHLAKQPVTFLWHESHDLENCDAVIVPGGFAYGDYLRTGAIAKFSTAEGWCSAFVMVFRSSASRDCSREL
jgi:phosphoribosylformylglycinamidine synthase